MTKDINYFKEITLRMPTGYAMPDYCLFVKRMKQFMKRFASGHDLDLTFIQSYYFISGFVQTKDKKTAYFAMYFDNNGDYKRLRQDILVRKALNASDFKGEGNYYSSLDDLESNLLKLLKGETICYR